MSSSSYANAVLLAAPFAFVAPSVSAVEFCNTTTIEIPANGTQGAAAPYPSEISVAGLQTVTDVNVKLLGLGHTYSQDIDVLLVGPQGQKVLLMSDAGNFEDVTGVDLTFDDSASGQFPIATKLVSGTYQPTNYTGGDDTFPSPAPSSPYDSQLAVFNNTEANGTWRLWVVDDDNPDKGSLAGGWCVDISSTSPSPSVSPNPSPSVSPSPSPSVSPGPSVSPSPSISPSPGASVSPSPSVGPSASPSPTPTETPTETPTPTATPTETPTATPTPPAQAIPVVGLMGAGVFAALLAAAGLLGFRRRR